MTQITDNKLKHRFELEIEGQIAFADYRYKENTLYIDHVETPVALRGKGTAGELMQGIMQLVDLNKTKIVPVCSYAMAWLQRHKEYNIIIKHG